MRQRWLLLVFSLSLHSTLEGAPGHVFGMVIYQRHEPLGGVRVRLSRGEHGFLRETTTDAKGYFRFRELPEGIYSLELELSGFAYAARRDFDVVSRMTSNFDIDMDLAVGESVLLAGQVPLIAPGEVPERLLRHRAFLEVLERGDLDRARRLLPGGVELSHGQAALGIAVRSGNDAMLRFLLDAAADPNAPAHEKWTALMSATRAGRTEAVHALLRSGADVGARSGDGVGLVELAAGRGDPKLLDLLLDHGAKVDARDDGGQTPLFHLAGDPEAVEMLLSAGAELDAHDGRGETPLMHLVRSLPTASSWLGARCEDCLDPLSRLLAAGADPDGKNEDGETGLASRSERPNAHLARCVRTR
jgi:hypothetical protein